MSCSFRADLARLAEHEVVALLHEHLGETIPSKGPTFPIAVARLQAELERRDPGMVEFD